MFIHNFRLGFATNSSSSHSIVVVPENMHIGDKEYENHFGWSPFILSSTENKVRYLAAQFFSNMGYSDDDHYEPSEVEKYVLEQIKEIIPDFTISDISPVDHQSVMSIERTKDTFDSLLKFFLNDRLVVLGGNDNSDNTPEIPHAVNVEPLNAAMSGSGRFKFKVEEDNIVSFDPTYGTKARYSFTNPAYTKSITPELVDLKITDFCAAGCNFCYQSSTKAGVHGDYDTIISIVNLLKDMNVFEIAIGGGEPTSHPLFVNILNYIHSNDITPNFTTMNGDWLEDDTIVQTVKRTVGAIGVSCLSSKGLDLAEKIKSQKIRVMAQHVFGSVPLHVTIDFIRQAFERNIPVMLLGFKDVGFGHDYPRHDLGDKDAVITQLQLSIDKHRYVSLSVDTALVDSFPELIHALNVPNALVTSPEGKFSCYVDAVTKQMGASSYVRPEQMRALPKSIGEFKELFATY